MLPSRLTTSSTGRLVIELASETTDWSEMRSQLLYYF
jgi:hypothetical protein